MDEMIYFSPDLKHDAHAVDVFEQRTIEHLKAQNVDIKCIYEFSDNCSSQYKSKAPFNKLSYSDIPIIHNFFCGKHGKCVADGAVGRTNQFVHCEIKTKKENIPNSEVLAKFCTEKLEISSKNGECQHYQRHFFHIPEIDRQGDTEAKTPGNRTVNPIHLHERDLSPVCIM